MRSRNRIATTAFFVSILVSALVAGAFGYAAKQHRQDLVDLAELPPGFDSTSLQDVESHLRHREADAMNRASLLAELDAAMERQDSDRVDEIREELLVEHGETTESISRLTLEEATREAAQAEQQLRTFHERSRPLDRDTAVALCSLALALALIAWEAARRFSGIGFKLVLAATSGFLAWFYFWEFARLSGFLPLSLDWLPDYGLPGMFFVAGVLFPYLARTSHAWSRALGLIVVATISFRSAIEVAVTLGRQVPLSIDIDMRAYLLASLVGAAIVLAGASVLVPLKRKLVLALAGLAAAIVGGLVFEPTEAWPFLAFMVWHSLLAIAVHVSENWRWRSAKAE